MILKWNYEIVLKSQTFHHWDRELFNCNRRCRLLFFSCFYTVIRCNSSLFRRNPSQRIVFLWTGMRSEPGLWDQKPAIMFIWKNRNVCQTHELNLNVQTRMITAFLSVCLSVQWPLRTWILQQPRPQQLWKATIMAPPQLKDQSPNGQIWCMSRYIQYENTGISSRSQEEYISIINSSEIL